MKKSDDGKLRLRSTWVPNSTLLPSSGAGMECPEALLHAPAMMKPSSCMTWSSAVSMALGIERPHIFFSFAADEPADAALEVEVDAIDLGGRRAGGGRRDFSQRCADGNWSGELEAYEEAMNE